MSQSAREDSFRFRLWHVMIAVAALSVLCATIPGAALVIVGGTPVALGFVVFVMADQKDHEGFRLLGAILMALGLFAGGFLMSFVNVISG